jgi:hypothetical protein
MSAKYMITATEFKILCGKYLIDHGVALENDYIMCLLQNMNFSKLDKDAVLFDLENTLKEEF